MLVLHKNNVSIHNYIQVFSEVWFDPSQPKGNMEYLIIQSQSLGFSKEIHVNASATLDFFHFH